MKCYQQVRRAIAAKACIKCFTGTCCTCSAGPITWAKAVEKKLVLPKGQCGVKARG